MTSGVVSVHYFLPVTKIHVTGSIITSRTKGGAVISSRPTSVVVTSATEPDFRYPCELSIPADQWADQKVTVNLTADGRLSSANSSATDHRWDAVGAVLKLGVTGAAVGASLGGVPGALIGAGAGLAIGAVGALHGAGPTGAVELIRRGTTDAEKTQTRDDLLSKAGVDPGYATHHIHDALLLAELRVAQATALVKFADLAAPDARNAGAVRDAHDMLAYIREELSRAELNYQAWLDQQVTVETTIFDVLVEIDKIPRRSDAVAWLKSDLDGDDAVRQLKDLCRQFKMLITLDPPPPAGGVAGPAPKHTLDEVAMASKAKEPSTCVYFRLLVPAVLQTFGTKSEDDDGSMQRSVNRLLVALPKNEQWVDLLTGGNRPAMSLSFDSTGALTAIATERTGASAGAVTALGKLPSTLNEAVTAGAGLAEPFTAAGRAAALKGQIDEMTLRQQLAAPADPDDKVKKQLAAAELQARVRAAERAANDPNAAVVVVIGGAG